MIKRLAKYLANLANRFFDWLHDIDTPMTEEEYMEMNDPEKWRYN